MSKLQSRALAPFCLRTRNTVLDSTYLACRLTRTCEHLEQVLQSELHDSARAGALNASELGTGEVSAGKAEVRVVQDVGSFRAEFDGLCFLEFEYSRQAGIDRPVLRTENRPRSHIAE